MRPRIDNDMKNYETINLWREAHGVAHLQLNRPDKKNALSAEMIDELSDCFGALSGETGTRVVVLSGAGGTFCAGGDLAWMNAQVSADRAGRMVEARKLADMLRLLNELPLPVIAKVDGDAYGGGVGLLCACDVVVASETARLGLTETRLGLIPATIGPYAIARMGEGRARRIFMSGRIFGADEAVSLGLVSRHVAAAELDAAVDREVAPYLATSRMAVAAAKALARSLGPRIDDAVIADTVRRLADTWETEDAKAGIDAFLSRRPSPWLVDRP
jgi:methylglutaconyl-CoA hydratase